METTYNGNDVFAPFNAGLYGYEDIGVDIDFDESKESILEAFKLEFENDIIKRLAEFGLEYIGLVYYSPREYNFSTDSIDLKLKIVDEKLLRDRLEAMRHQIEQAMKNNKPYDGYMPTTMLEWKDLISRGELDILAVTEILKSIDFSAFEIDDYLVREPYDEEE